MSNTGISPAVGSAFLAATAPGCFNWGALVPAVFVDVRGVPGLKWSGLTTAAPLGAAAKIDTAAPPPGWRGARFAASGTFGAGGSVVLQGSTDGVTWTPLLIGGSPAVLTGPGNFAWLDASAATVTYVRPSVTGDGTTSITVTATFGP